MLRERIIDILDAMGESLLNDDGVDLVVAGEIADAIERTIFLPCDLAMVLTGLKLLEKVISAELLTSEEKEILTDAGLFTSPEAAEVRLLLDRLNA